MEYRGVDRLYNPVPPHQHEEPDPAAAEGDGDDGEDDSPIQVLWCSGDAPSSTTQHNFEGSWTLHEEMKLINNRPHYFHVTPDGTMVHLFYVEHQTQTPPGRAPRWMIGPTPGNGVNGWAYADSDAAAPDEIYEPWLAWMKETSSWAEARLGFKEKNSGLGQDEDEDEDEAPGNSKSPEGGGKKKKGAKKKKKKSKGGSPPKAGSKGKKSAR